MHEITINLHMHTRYSDGSGSHDDIAAAALTAGLDAVIVTDHNVLVRGFEGYIKQGRRHMLMLIGEEIHDQDREPQKNHLLAFGMDEEVSTFADEPQSLINAVGNAGGLSFIAHPNDPAAPAVGEPDISWVDWTVHNFTGIELWNGLSELKSLLSTRLHGALYAFFPALVAHTPPPETLRKWDELLATGRVVAVGGSDAHALHLHLGPLHRIVFPYEFHFRAINTHVLIPKPLSGDVNTDRTTIREALRAGHCFVGYDLPSPTQGFRFVAHGREADAVMGDEITGYGGVTLQAHLPSLAEIRLLKDGETIQTARKASDLTYRTSGEPGVYRIEAYRWYLGRKRGWIFSNPIYIR